MDLHTLTGKNEDGLGAAERSLWQSIQKLESQKSQLEEDKAKLLYNFQVQNISADEFKARNQQLDDQLVEIDFQIENAVQKLKRGAGGMKAIVKTEAQALAESHHKLQMYHALLDKYSGLINEAENKTIPQIKSLIMPNDLSIQSLCEKFKPADYDFEINYLETAKKVYDFLAAEFDVVQLDLKLNYWLSPKEFLDLKLGDSQDFAVFYCSVLASLGDSNARIVIAELENTHVHAVVETFYHNKFHLFDLAQKRPFEFFASTDKETLYKKYSFEGAKIRQIIYSFNGENYEQHIE